MLQSFIAYPSAVLIECLMLALAIRWFIVPLDRKKTELLFLVCVATHPIAFLIQNTLRLLAQYIPIKYDLYIFRFDTHFGEPSFRVGQFFLAHHLEVFGSFIYNLPLALTVGIFGLYLWTGRDAWFVARIELLHWLLLVPLYLILPVSGPRYAFAAFPSLPSASALHSAAIPGAPNGVPSGHMAGALITIYLLRHWPRLALLSVFFAVATAFTALGSGEHYLFDLLCAVPFAALVIWASNEQKPKTWPERTSSPWDSAWNSWFPDIARSPEQLASDKSMGAFRVQRSYMEKDASVSVGRVASD